MCRAACDQLFESLQLRRIVAYHHPSNARSAALLQRLGFRVRSSLTVIPQPLAGVVRPHVMAVLERPT
jgi:RimJ/RimL family protein N-acetyltransferase